MHASPVLRPSSWHAWAHAALGLLPHTCLVCGSWSDAGLCAPCVARFAARRPRCASCALPMPQAAYRCGHCLREQPVLDGVVAAVDYGQPWSRLVAQMKFHGQPRLAQVLAGRLVEAIRAAPATPGAVDLPSLVLPVPMTDARLGERGYNQAWELARRVAGGLSLPSDAGLLLRLHDAPNQVGLDRRSRIANLQGVFAVEPRRRARLHGATVAVIDDVMTTGATLAEAARTLRQAGAAQVVGWVFARTT